MIFVSSRGYLGDSAGEWDKFIEYLISDFWLCDVLYNDISHIDGSAQDRSNSSAYASKLPQSCAKPLMYSHDYV